MASVSDQGQRGTDDVESLDLEDLETSQAEEEEDGGIVSPRELTHINFRSLIGHTDEVNTCAFAPDWSKVVTGGDDMLVKLWDTKTGKVLFTMDAHHGAIKCVCFSCDGQLFASASYDHTVRVYDAATGSEIFCLKETGPPFYVVIRAMMLSANGHTHSVETCCFSPDAKFLCSGSWDNSGIVWNMKTGTPAFVLDGHRNVVQSCAFSSDSKTVATGSWDCCVRLWPLGKNKTAMKVLQGHKSNIHALTFSCDNVLASASWDTTVRLWETERGILLHTLKGHTGWVQACSFSADGKRLASASDDQMVRIWDTESGRCLKELECDTEEIHTCCFTASGSLFASGPAEAETTICIY